MHVCGETLEFGVSFFDLLVNVAKQVKNRIQGDFQFFGLVHLGPMRLGVPHGRARTVLSITEDAKQMGVAEVRGRAWPETWS